MKESLLIYRSAGAATPPEDQVWDLSWLEPMALRWDVWRPSRFWRGPVGSSWLKYRLYSILALVGVFSRPGLAALQLWSDGQMVHRSVVFPNHWRFDFMRPGDLQVGDVWTAPSWRGKGIAAQVLDTVRRSLATDRAIWWLCSPANVASQKVAQRASLSLVGKSDFRSGALPGVLGRYHLLDS